MGAFLASLPSSSRERNDPARCQLNHIEHDDAENLLAKHQMRRVLTKCRSTRCRDSGVVCECTYRLLMCEASDLASVSVDGEHTMTDPNTFSLKALRLTVSMQKWIEERLAEDASILPVDLFGLLVKKIDTGYLLGPPPKVTQVQTFVKKWRKQNKRDAMQPVIDLCAARMYDVTENVAHTGDNLLVMCDTTREDNILVPKLGTGSATSPFRIGFTCFTLLDNYVTIQRDPRCTTLLHVDSTHSIVKQRYLFSFSGYRIVVGNFFQSRTFVRLSGPVQTSSGAAHF